MNIEVLYRVIVSSNEYFFWHSTENTSGIIIPVNIRAQFKACRIIVIIIIIIILFSYSYVYAACSQFYIYF